eukprot:9445518-Pyramimonas_sp.AAC.1
MWNMYRAEIAGSLRTRSGSTVARMWQATLTINKTMRPVLISQWISPAIYPRMCRSSSLATFTIRPVPIALLASPAKLGIAWNSKSEQVNAQRSTSPAACGN